MKTIRNLMELANSISNELNAQGFITEAQETVKNGVSYIGIIIAEQPDQKIRPVVHLMEKDLELSVSEVTQKILNIYNGCEKKPFDDSEIPSLMKWELVKDRIMPRLLRKTEEDCISLSYLDMEVEFVVNLLNSNASTRIKPQLLSHWGIDESEVFGVALNNLRAEQWRLENMSFIIRKMLREQGITDEVIDRMLADTPDDVGMYVLTNSNCWYGATHIICAKVLSEVAQQLQCETFYVIPSSVHEVIVVPDGIGVTPEELSGLVKQVNRTEVAEHEQLSDHVYYFNGEKLVSC